MYQPKKEILHTCKTEIKRIGHNLDTSILSVSVEDICKRQIDYSVSLPQAKNSNNTFNHHTLHFETFFALCSYQFCAPSLTYLEEKTFLKEITVDLALHIDGNAKEQTTYCFQSNPEKQKNRIIFSNGEMTPFET